MEESDKVFKPRPKMRKECTICGKRIVNLNRHLREVHNETVPKSREYLVVSKRGYIKRVCPLCSGSIERMRDHLSRTHGVTDHESLNRLMGQAKPVRQHGRRQHSEGGRIDARGKHLVSS